MGLARVIAGVGLAVVCASVGACSATRAAVTTPPVHVIAWSDAVPRQVQPVRAPLAPPCRASRLRVVGSGFQFAAGLADGTGAVALRNIGPGSCSLTGYPAVRLVGAPRAPAQKQVDLPVQPGAFPEILEPTATLHSLAPGGTAVLGIDWSNWCVPGAIGSPKPQVPPAAVRVSLGSGSLDVNYNAVPACQAPGEPSTIGVRPFAPAPLPASQPWTTANVQATIQGLTGAALTARRGQVARFVVRLRNTSSVAVRFAQCPLIAEVLAPAGQTEVHQLNCRAAGSVPPGGSAYFEMRISVPSAAPLGKNGLLWELDPTGAQYPEAVSSLVVTRS